MEDLVSCNICAQVFDSLYFIPKMLKCGHTFCSPCLIKLLQENPRCPNCRAEVNEIESSLPVNYDILKAVDFHKSKCWPERKMNIVTEVAKRKDIILKKKTQMTKILDKCLEKLEELTMSQSERIDTENTRKILDEIDEDLKKTDDDLRSDNIKSYISILLLSFRNSEQFLLKISKKLQNGEKVFAVHKINEEFKYGEVSFFSNQLFFHCLSLSKVPKDSSLVWFEDVKQCLNSKDFCTFLKIHCYKKNVTSFVIIETLDQYLCNEFIKLCTGECGPSYKGSFFEKRRMYRNAFSKDLTNVLSVHKDIENESEEMRLKDYKRCDQNHQSASFNENEMLLYLNKYNGGFLMVRYKSAFYDNWNITSVLTSICRLNITSPPYIPNITFRPPIGRVISPLTLYKDINDENSSNLILDCGILINL
ncbi:UNVERIFIED_CONTAM: hypothetical protein RMT77_016584 [Armadillidium vulgare]